MNRCLCCGKPLPEDASARERRDSWHKACCRRFFGTAELPELDISEQTLIQIAQETTNRGFTVPGVQKKISLHLTSAGEHPRLTLVDYPTGYILKPQTEAYEALPEAEHLVMRMAEKSGISTVPFALLRTGEEKKGTAYITRRVDRIPPKGRGGRSGILAMEDFCQLERHLTENKYLGSYERCAGVIRRWSSRPGLDMAEFFLRILFCFATGNSDMHLKNFSLIETEPCSGEYILSPAYDLLPVNVIVPEDTEQMALTVNGKKRNLHRSDFLRFAETAGIGKDAAIRMIRSITEQMPVYLQMCADSYLPEPMKTAFAALIEERISALQPKTDR